MFQGPGKIHPAILECATELEHLCLRFHVSRHDLFGSAATGRFRDEDSDFDFLVEFLPEAVTNYADNYFGLLEGLEGLFGNPVDLVVKRAIRNPWFLQSVEETRTLIYAA